MYFVLLAGERGVLGMQVKPLQGKHSVAEPHPSQEMRVAVLTISIESSCKLSDMSFWGPFSRTFAWEKRA